MTEETRPEEQEVTKLNPIVKIVNIFTSPTSVFENLRVHPDWLIPVLMMILLTIIFALSTEDLTLELQKEAIYNNKFIPEEMKDQAIEGLENKSEMRTNIEAVGGSIVNIFIVYLIASAALLIFGNFIYGGSIPFKQVFSMYSWGSLIGGVELIVKLPIAISKGSLKVYTSLALFMDPSESKTVMFKILDAFDIFTIWKIVIWSIGFSIIYKFSKAKSYSAVIILYVIYLAITIGISQLLGGIF